MGSPTTEDWRRAHARGVYERKEQLIRQGVDPYAADRRAEREQTQSTERARATFEDR